MSSSLLADAIDYAVGSVACVAPDLLSRPTPCRDWDLAALLGHANDSLAALHQGLATGYVGLNRTGPEQASRDQASRERATDLRAVSAASPARSVITKERGGM